MPFYETSDIYIAIIHNIATWTMTWHSHFPWIITMYTCWLLTVSDNLFMDLSQSKANSQLQAYIMYTKDQKQWLWSMNYLASTINLPVNYYNSDDRQGNWVRWQCHICCMTIIKALVFATIIYEVWMGLEKLQRKKFVLFINWIKILSIYGQQFV